jgi:uncharacterized protein (TIGR02217 family)
MFYEINFPDSVAFSSVSSLFFDTNIVKSKNNTEQRSPNLNFSMSSFRLSAPLKNKPEIEEIITLFKIVKGKLGGFRFKDWLDYKVENQIIGIGDGENCTFQIKKTYQLQSYFTMRDISKPAQGTVKVFLNYLECNHLLQSIDHTKGLVTFASPPSEGSIITVNCEFDIPVRFKDDCLNITMLGKNSYEIKDLELIEIKDYEA